MNFCTNSATYGITQLLALYNNGKLIMYNNPQPATPETALAGTNTALCTFTFAATAFGAPAFSTPNDAATASFVASSVTPGANGTVTFARATLTSAAWAANATYAAYAIVSNSSNFYVQAGLQGIAAASGGPSNAAAGVSVIDNTCRWLYYSGSGTQNNVLGDFSVGTAATDIVIGNTAITTTVNVTMTSFVLQLTAS